VGVNIIYVTFKLVKKISGVSGVKKLVEENGGIRVVESIRMMHVGARVGRVGWGEGDGRVIRGWAGPDMTHVWRRGYGVRAVIRTILTLMLWVVTKVNENVNAKGGKKQRGRRRNGRGRWDGGTHSRAWAVAGGRALPVPAWWWSWCTRSSVVVKREGYQMKKMEKEHR
jgi:hypothetical protein